MLGYFFADESGEGEGEKDAKCDADAGDPIGLER